MTPTNSRSVTMIDADQFDAVYFRWWMISTEGVKSQASWYFFVIIEAFSSHCCIHRRTRVEVFPSAGHHIQMCILTSWGFRAQTPWILFSIVILTLIFIFPGTVIIHEIARHSIQYLILGVDLFSSRSAARKDVGVTSCNLSSSSRNVKSSANRKYWGERC